MGPAQRQPNSALIQQLLSAPQGFEFFQAVRLLEQHLDRVRGGRSSRRVGFDHAASDVGLRLQTAPSLAFPPQAIVAIRGGGAGDAFDARSSPYAMQVSFLGLIGAAGTLPTSYTELLIRRIHGKDVALREFLDAFQERGLAFFYRAWKKYRLSTSFSDADLQRGKPDPVLEAILAIVGLLPRPRGEALGADALSQVFHAGHFSNRRRSAHGLEALLQGLLGCAVRVEQFVGQWIDIGEDAWSRLGSGHGPGVSARLDGESVLGSRAWCVDARVRVVAGPLSRERFRRLWPGGEPVRHVWQVLRAYLGPLIECDLEWRLAPDAPAPLQLGGDHRLGRDGWLGWGADGQPDLQVSSPPWHISDPTRANPRTVSV